ncbi:MAG: PD40 domain-containing protein [Planctomycetes bacterium]|nr:PD40 domain-containing protein [Planctomycetota bacterium]
MKPIPAGMLLLAACASAEPRLSNLRQLTSGGTHAEAYWSPDGTKLVFQALREGDPADQIYVLDLATGAVRRISDGKGKTTCAYFLPDGRIVYSSTKAAGDAPPPPPDRSKGYVWPLYREFDIYLLDPATGEERRLTDSDGYDAETTVSPDGKRLVFMSQRDGAFGLYTMNVDGSDLRKVTRRRCYTGGAFFSPDGRQLVYRSFCPKDARDEDMLNKMLDRRALIPFKGMVIEIYVADADGGNERAVTSMGKINFAPTFHPDGKRIIFTSDAMAQTRGGYNLFLVNADGTGLEQVTRHNGFDGFPHFSPDGKRLVFVSDRNATRPHELNIFLADWRD